MIAAKRMTAVAAGCGLLILAACQDGQAKRRAEVHEMIAAATKQISSADAVLSDPSQVDEARRRFGRVIVELGNTQGGAPGQRAAAAELAAGVHRRLAAISVDKAMKIEAELGSRRSVLIGMIEAADQLDGMATGLEAVDVSAADAKLAAAREDAQETLAATSRRLAELDGPIAELTRDNRSDQDEAQRLRIEAAVLRREAADLGAADGYGVFVEAQRIDRAADGVELRLAHRELDLRYNYEPEHAIAQIKVDRMRERLDSIAATREALQARSETAVGEAGTTRTRLDEISSSIEAALDELQASAATLAELYDEAAMELDRAASKAKAAASLAGNDFADAARIAAAQAYQELGSLHRSRARGLQSHIMLMERAVEVTGAAAGSVDSVREARREQLSKAAEAYGNAGSELGRVSGRTSRQRLETLKMSTSLLETGDVVEETRPSGAPPRPTARPSRHTEPTGGGAESPEALMAAMLDESYAHPVDLFYFGNLTPAQARLVDAFKAGQSTQLKLVAALRERFADELATADGSLLASIANRNMSMGAVEGDKGTFIQSVGGLEVPVAIVAIHGRWYIDASSTMAESASQAAALGQSPAELMASVTVFMGELTGRIEAGEFGTLQDVDMAFMEALMTGFGSGG